MLFTRTVLCTIFLPKCQPQYSSFATSPSKLSYTPNDPPFKCIVKSTPKTHSLKSPTPCQPLTSHNRKSTTVAFPSCSEPKPSEKRAFHEKATQHANLPSVLHTSPIHPPTFRREKDQIFPINRVPHTDKPFTLSEVARLLMGRITSGGSMEYDSKEMIFLRKSKDIYRCMGRVYLGSKLAPRLLSFLIGRDNGITNLFMYNKVISAAVGFLKVDIGEMLFDQMLLDNIAPSVQTYNTLIRAYMMESSTDKAVRIYKEIKENGLLPDIQTYALMIGGHLENTQHKQARGVFNDLNDQLKLEKCTALPPPTFECLLAEYKQDCLIDISK